MMKYQYMTISFTENDDLVDIYNQYGEQGWRRVKEAGNCILFERKVSREFKKSEDQEHG